MPRTIEQIVDCHVAARALRKAGKPIWRLTIDIKSILHEDQSNTSPEHLASVANRIGKLVRALAPQSMFDFESDDYDGELAEVIECMEECTTAALAEDVTNGVDAIDMLNGWIDSLYDWADRNRVWLGL